MPHTCSQGAPEFELSSPEQILRARHQVSFLDLPFDMEQQPHPPLSRTIHELASHGVVGARSAITLLGVNNNNRQIPSHVISTITNST
ncbi:hypothetical protein E3N88_25861 [Mikania micrantha]|uniref:Uncharacterized protein n=1 Tax=Mikania micrantha TaxID=192012 RepID=A0A5N6N6W3_9ASTR|nr:hypothetical protein E3N88_25861 [Mikania micrantha]